MKELVKEEVVAGLQNSIATVTFVKKDGTKRVMLATLDPFFLPDPTLSESTREPNDEVVTCWDIEVNDWRSFRLDSVEDILYTPTDDKYA